MQILQLGKVQKEKKKKKKGRRKVTRERWEEGWVVLLWRISMRR